MKTRTEYTCPLELTHDITKGKWKPIILWQLGKGPHSLAGLKREIKGISQKMLIEQLRELCDYGYPLKVEYSLTRRGTKMLEAVVIMQGIGIEMMMEDGKEEFLRKKGLLD